MKILSLGLILLVFLAGCSKPEEQLMDEEIADVEEFVESELDLNQTTT